MLFRSVQKTRDWVSEQLLNDQYLLSSVMFLAVLLKSKTKLLSFFQILLVPNRISGGSGDFHICQRVYKDILAGPVVL